MRQAVWGMAIGILVLFAACDGGDRAEKTGEPEKPYGMTEEIQKKVGEAVAVVKQKAEKTVEATSGGGMVKVVANGRQQVLSIQIEKEVVDPDDVDMLQDLVLAAVNDALLKSQEMVTNEMNKLTGGINIPGLT